MQAPGPQAAQGSQGAQGAIQALIAALVKAFAPRSIVDRPKALQQGENEGTLADQLGGQQ